MNARKWILFSLAFLMIAGTAGWIYRVKSRLVYEKPGVKVTNDPLLGPDSKYVRTNSVWLPVQVPGLKATHAPIARGELELPADTTFGRCQYDFPDHQFSVTATAVLMGTDRSSIHQPEICLTLQGWTIDRAQIVKLSIPRPYPYEMEVSRLTTSIAIPQPNGPPVIRNGLYVYWFVSEHRLSSRHASRMFTQAKTWLLTDKTERWAYISLFSVFDPGQEEEAMSRIATVAGAIVPEFQLTTGQPLDKHP
jgi:hypothetical protein